MGNKFEPISSDEIIKEGYLFKQSRYLEKWRQRWIVLTNTNLCTFKEKEVYSNPTEQIYLNTIRFINGNDDESNAIFVRYNIL